MSVDHTEPYRTLSVSNLHEKIMSRIDALPPDTGEQVMLLRIPEVIQWLLGDTRFLDPENPITGYKKKPVKEEDGLYKNGKTKKKTVYVDDQSKPIYQYNTKGAMTKAMSLEENAWNMRLLEEKRPDLFKKPHKQASLFGKFGEEIVKEHYILVGEYITNKPESKNGHQLDLETIRDMVEVKTGSYFTTGTAGEKIYGVPWKYADVPRLYNKPLLIVCVGGGGDRTDLVIDSDVPERNRLRQFWKDEMRITFIGFTSLLSNL